MLRSTDPSARLLPALVLCALVGVAAALLVAAGNPPNMGICGACFLRDVAGAVGLHDKAPVAVFRPEIVGLMLGALALAVARRKFQARSGSHAATRFLMGVLMAFGALVFLGCPFRLLQRLGGGDLNAVVGGAGLVAGVGVALGLERRGYSVGRTSPAPAPVGLLGPGVLLLLLALFLAGGVLRGPGPGEGTGPAHAPWWMALGIAAAAGAALSATSFCAISATRQVFGGPRRMLAGAGLLVLGYAAVAAATGRFSAGFDRQPVAHTEHLWNFLAVALTGLAAALAGGCPVRQVVMAGEGNGDAFLAVAGLVTGGALAHGLGIASSPAGTTPAGRTVVVAGLAVATVYGLAVAAASRTATPPSAPAA